MRLRQRESLKGHDAAALEASERARARNLLMILAEAHADIRQGVDPSLLERERRVQQQLDAKARYRMQLLSSQHTQEQAAAVEVAEQRGEVLRVRGAEALRPRTVDLAG